MAILLALGNWQLQRLAWKESLIATLDDRTNAAAMPLPSPGALLEEDLTALEFRRVALSGQFQTAAVMKLLNRTLEGRVGVHVIVPVARPAGDVVLVDLGWAPAEADLPDFTGTIAIEGFVRLFRTPGPFVPNNDTELGLWYAMEAEEMAAAAGVAAVAPVYVTRAPDVAAAGYPRAVAPAKNLRNDHLQYAITWLALAAGLLIVFVVFHTRRVDV